MGFKNYPENFNTSNNITTLDNLEDNPEFRVFNVNETVIITYKPTLSDFN